MVDDIQEEWKPVVGYEGVYEVSSHGQIKRVTATNRAPAGLILKLQKDPDGYRTVLLSVNSVFKTHRVHKLVLAAFVGPRPTKQTINHIDGVKHNNRLSNLEY